MPTFRENLHLGTHDPLITNDDLACDSVGPCQIQDDAVSLEKLTPGVRSIFTTLTDALAAESEARQQADLGLQNDVRTIQQKMVRSISVNNGAPILPDSSGNIHLHLRSGEGGDPDDLTSIYDRLDALEAKPSIVAFWQEEEPSTEDLPANTLWYDTENAVLKVLVTPEGSSPFWATVSQPSEGFYVFYESSEGESIPRLYFCKDGEFSPFPTGGGPTPNVKQEWQLANPTDIVSKQAINSQLTAIRQEMTDIAGGDVTFGTYTGKILIPTPEEYDETKVKTYLNPGDFIINKAPEDITAEDVLAYHIDEIPYTELEVYNASEIGLQASETYDDTKARSNATTLKTFLSTHPSCKVIRLGSNMYPIYPPSFDGWNNYAYTSHACDLPENYQWYSIKLDRDLRFEGDVDENGKAAGGFLVYRSSLFYTEYSLELVNVRVVANAGGASQKDFGYPFFLWPNRENGNGIDHLIVRNCSLESVSSKYVYAWFHVSREDLAYRQSVTQIIDTNNCFHHILIENTSCQQSLINAVTSDSSVSQNFGATLVTHSCRFVNNTITNLNSVGIGLGTGNEGSFNSTAGFANCPIWIVGCSFYGRAIDGQMAFLRSGSGNYRGAALIESSRCYFLRNKVIDFLAVGAKTSGSTVAQYDIYGQAREMFFVNNEVRNMVRMCITEETGGTLKVKGTCTPASAQPYVTSDFEDVAITSGVTTTTYKRLKDDAVRKTALPYTRYYTNNKYILDKDAVADAWNEHEFTPLEYTYFKKSTRANSLIYLDFWQTSEPSASQSNLNMYWYDTTNSKVKKCTAHTSDSTTTYSWDEQSVTWSTAKIYVCYKEANAEDYSIYRYENNTLVDYTSNIMDEFNDTDTGFNLEEWLILMLGVYDAPTSTSSSLSNMAANAEFSKLVFSNNYIDYPAINSGSDGHQWPVGTLEVEGNYFKTKYIPTQEYSPAPSRETNGTHENRYLFSLMFTEVLKFNDNVFTAQPPAGTDKWHINAILYRYRTDQSETARNVHWDRLRPAVPSKICEMRDNAFKFAQKDGTIANNSVLTMWGQNLITYTKPQIHPFMNDVSSSGGGPSEERIKEIAEETINEVLAPETVTPDATTADFVGEYKYNKDIEKDYVVEDTSANVMYKLDVVGSEPSLAFSVNGNIGTSGLLSSHGSFSIKANKAGEQIITFLDVSGFNESDILDSNGTLLNPIVDLKRTFIETSRAGSSTPFTPRQNFLRGLYLYIKNNYAQYCDVGIDASSFHTFYIYPKKAISVPINDCVIDSEGYMDGERNAAVVPISKNNLVWKAGADNNWIPIEQGYGGPLADWVEKTDQITNVPSSPTTGMVYYDTSTSKLMVCTNASTTPPTWVSILDLINNQS